MDVSWLGRRLMRRATPARPSLGGDADAWADAFARLSRDALTWEVAGRPADRAGAYAWEYSVRRRGAVPAAAYGATKIAQRLDVEELLEVERAARRGIREGRWIIVPGSAEWSLERQASVALGVQLAWPDADAAGPLCHEARSAR